MAPAEQFPDPDGIHAGIANYRGLAKYLLTIFAGIGAVFVAGTPLSAIGELSWPNDGLRIAIAALGFSVALGAVLWVVQSAFTVLKPIELTLDAVVEDEEMSTEANSRAGGLGGLDSVKELRDVLRGSLLPADRVDEWRDVAARVVDEAGFSCVRKRFESAWTNMLIGALLATLGIITFVWAANPPPETPPEPTGSVLVLRPASAA